VKAGGPAKSIVNWIAGDLGRMANERGVSVDAIGLSAKRLAEFVQLVEGGKVARQAASRELLPALLDGDASPAAVVEGLGLAQVDDEALIRTLAEEAKRENPKAVEDYRGGKKKALGALKGQIMRATRGKAHPQRVHEVLLSVLDENG